MKHCLVVGESRVTRKVARKILEDMSFYTEEATESASALQACRTQMPDIVFIDMTGPDGIEFMRSLRRSARDKQPVLVYATTEYDPAQLREAAGAGGNRHVMKPLDRPSMQSAFAPLAA